MPIEMCWVYILYMLEYMKWGFDFWTLNLLRDCKIMNTKCSNYDLTILLISLW